MITEDLKVVDCLDCDLCLNRNTIVSGFGDPHAKIMFIGEAPGYQENKHGIPFIGDTGQMLNKLLDMFGFSRDKVYVTNIIKCRPPNNATPTHVQIETCKKYVIQEINTVKPRIIVPLGGIAFRTLTGNVNLSISQARGIPIPTDKFVILPMFHPSYVMRNLNDQGVVLLAITDFRTLVTLYRYIDPLHKTKV